MWYDKLTLTCKELYKEESLKCWVIGIEKGEETNRWHLQCYFGFTQRRNLTWVQKNIYRGACPGEKETIRFGVANGSAQENFTYCTRMENSNVKENSVEDKVQELICRLFKNRPSELPEILTPCSAFMNTISDLCADMEGGSKNSNNLFWKNEEEKQDLNLQGFTHLLESLEPENLEEPTGKPPEIMETSIYSSNHLDLGMMDIEDTKPLSSMNSLETEYPYQSFNRSPMDTPTECQSKTHITYGGQMSSISPQMYTQTIGGPKHDSWQRMLKSGRVSEEESKLQFFEENGHHRMTVHLPKKSLYNLAVEETDKGSIRLVLWQGSSLPTHPKLK